MSARRFPDDSLQSQRDILSARYDVVEKEVVIDRAVFTMLKVRDTNALVESIDPEIFSVDERLPYWADIWTSAFELARYCLADPGLKGKRVLELGCGLGLAGIAAAKAGALVSFTDYEQDALDFARYNAASNLSLDFASPKFFQLDWRIDPKSLLLNQKFDVILAADVVYERRNFFPLIGILHHFLAPEGVAVFTEPGRSIGEQFFRLLSEDDFHVSVTPCRVVIDGKTADVRRAIIRQKSTGELSTYD